MSRVRLLSSRLYSVSVYIVGGPGPEEAKMAKQILADVEARKTKEEEDMKKATEAEKVRRRKAEEDEAESKRKTENAVVPHYALQWMQDERTQVRT